MMQAREIVPSCPVCGNNKLKSFQALLQHLVQSHPDGEEVQRMLRAFRYPHRCKDCLKLMDSLTAHILHAKSLHPESFTELVDLAMGKKTPDKGLVLGTQQRTETYYEEDPSRICLYAVGEPPMVDLTLISMDGPMRVGNWDMLRETLRTGARLLIFGKAKARDWLLDSLSDVVNPDIISNDVFTTVEFLDAIRLSRRRDYAEILFDYLSSIHFFETPAEVPEPTFVCPICRKEFMTEMDLYRCLFRTHTPFPHFVMNKHKASEALQGEFHCIRCGENAGSFDGLIQHVYRRHRRQLLEMTKKERGELNRYEFRDFDRWLTTELAKL
jgi:hypothetical protein